MRSFEWIREGWALFLGAPGVWLLLGGGIVLWFVVAEFLWLQIRTRFDPSLLRNLSLAVLLFGPVILMPAATAGGLQLCRRLARDQPAELSDLLGGIQQAPQRLLGAGLLYLAGWLIIFLFYELINGPLALFLPTLAGFLFLIAIWFVPPLVAFHNLSPFEALSRSFSACFKNAGVFVVFGLTMGLLHLVAVLPAGLGLIVLLPVMIGTLHASYRDVFPES